MQPPSAESKIDLTPMLDVVFIMLIFFVVTATFVIEQGIDVNNSSDNQPPPPPDPNKPAILVDITANSRFVVNGSGVDVRLLGAQLKQLHAQDPQAPVIIRPHDEASTQSLIQAMDYAALAGVSDVKFAR